MLSTMQQPKEPEEELPKGVILRDFDDFTTLRNQIFDGVKNSMIKSFPAEYGNVRLELHDVDYDNLDDVPVSEQKKNLLENKYITKKLRGTIKLFDKTNDQLLEEKRISLMKVPYLTNRGTFIHGGNEYASIMQSRLLPGVYTRRQANGELETQFNVKPGTGIGFRVGFEPETTQYRVKISQANLHLYSLLKDIGTSDKELEKAWGPEILRANQMKYDARVFDKAYDRLVSARQKKVDKTREDKVNSLKNAFEAAQIHARVAQKNLPNMFDPKVAAEWEARWQGKQAMEKLAAENIDSIPFEPDLTPKEAAETFIDEDVLADIENEKSASVNSRKAVIIKGNPAYIKDNADADKFYSQIESLLKNLGYEVGFDAGEPHTVPDEDADLWIGHSRGADRLRFAPSKTRTVKLDDYEPEDYRSSQEKEYSRLLKELGVKRVADIPEDKRPKPGKEHFTFNEAMQEAVKSAADMHALMQARRHSAQAKEEYKKKTAIMAAALARYPDEFIVDQDGRMSGIVHLPTGFRIHVPREVIPDKVKRIFQEVEDDENYEASKEAAWKDLPFKVLQALKAGDYELLKEYGRRGGRAAAKLRLPKVKSINPLSDDAVNKHLQHPDVQHFLSILEKDASENLEFGPDFSPEDIQDAYNAIYGHYGPRLASMDKWPAEWIKSDVDPMGWLQWYEQYKAGRRTDDDARQIKRWKSFKARHGSQFKKNPTPRRAFALRNWAIDPLKMIEDEDQRRQLAEAMENYKQKAWENYNNNQER